MAKAAKRAAPAEGYPWDSPRLEPGQIAALKALKAGVANEGQQRVAFATIVDDIARAGRVSFVGGGDEGRRATDFAEGRRWVGLMINEACNVVVPHNPRGPEPPMPAEKGSD